MHNLKVILLVIGSIVILLYCFLWLMSIQKYPVEYGISFDKNHAIYLGYDWQKVYIAMLDDLKPKYIRLAANWNEVEKIQDNFDITELDWQMNEAVMRGVKVTLVVGQKTPRWPECQIPGWASQLSTLNYKQEALQYVKFVVEKYKNHPALDVWQVENEPFIKFEFGNCAFFDQSLVAEEAALVRSLDSERRTLLTDSGEMGAWFNASRLGDIFGTTLYRTVRTPGGFVWSYNWLPAGMYKLKARLWGKGYNDFFVSELQAEPWFNGADPRQIDVSEQEMTMSLKRLQKNINYASRVGASRVYFWGVEWWYFMKEKNNDAGYWDLIKGL